MEEFDLVVIGAGSGGVRASRLAAQSGARVAVAEGSDLGGTCVNLGCIPKKLFSYAAGFSQAAADAHGFGWDVAPPSLDWPRLRENKNREILRLNGIYAKLLEGAGVRVVKGRARLRDLGDGRGCVAADGREIAAAKVLVATGSAPSRPTGIEGLEMAWVSDDMFHLPSLPRSLLVLGGGYIAVEFASIMAGLGVETSLAYRGGLFLRGFDLGLRRHLLQALEHQGVRLYMNHAPQKLEEAGEGRRVRFANGQALEAESVLQALGRAPCTQGLGLEEMGLELGPGGALEAGDDYNAGLPWLYALGDVLGGPQLTPYAIAQAVDFHAQHWLRKPPRGRRRIIPTAVFTHPQLGTVGLTEDQAARQGKAWVYEASFRSLQDAFGGDAVPVFVKLVVAEDPDGPVVGAHMAGEGAAEVIQALAIAVESGLRKSEWDATLPVHPTVAEEFVTLREAREARPDDR